MLKKTSRERRHIAIFHATLKTFSRSKGHSATAAAAYRAGERISDSRTGLVHDYRRKEGVVSSKLFAPLNAPSWAIGSARLWNAAEQAETRVNSRTARELEVALPAELDGHQREAMAHELARVLVERYGVAVMAAIHEPGKGGDQRNHHVHLLMTTRVVNATGFGEKVRVLDDQKTGPVEVAVLRSLVSELINRHLARAGLAERVDHRTLDEQAGAAAVRGDLAKVLTLSREATRHHGKSATALLRRGERSDRVMGTLGILADNVERAKVGHDRAIQHLASAHNATRRSKGGMRPPRVSSRPISRAQLRATNANLGETQLLVRATGKDARLLNSQATVLQEGLRAARDSARAQLEALATTVRNSAALADAYFRQVTMAAHDARAMPVRAPNPEIFETEAPRNAGKSSAAAPKGYTPSSRMTRRKWAELRRSQRSVRSGEVKPGRPARPPNDNLGSRATPLENVKDICISGRQPGATRLPKADRPIPKPRFRRPQP